MADSTNLTMRDRVALLRLPSQADASGSASQLSWLPWMLTLLLAFSTVSLFVRSLSLKPASSTPTPEIASTQPGAASATNLSPKSTTAVVAPGAVALESKGYIIPAHQIQVSPVEVAGRIVELNIE